MKPTNAHSWLNYFIASVWIINGLFCKVLNIVPRHREIVGRVLNTNHPSTITLLIGVSEVFMAIWILIRIKTRLNAVTQIIIIATMNILEFFLASDLLLWGRLNLVFAILFILLICYNEFYLGKKITRQASWLYL